MNIAEWKDVWRRFSGHGTYPHELAAMLLFPLRRVVLSPKKLIPYLNLGRTSRVLEIGPGPGFFSIDVAKAIPEGRLELVDIQREMLEKARRRLQRAGIPNVGYTQATAATLPFQSRTFDVAFLVAVLGEVADPTACVRSIAGVLRPEGVLVVAELPGDPDALTEEQLRGFAQGTELEFVESNRVSRSVITRFRRGVTKWLSAIGISVLFSAGVSAQAPANLLRNTAADEGTLGWRGHGQATVEEMDESVGCV